MPEGPEVTIIAKGLNSLLKNKAISNFEILNQSRYYNKHPDGYNVFISNINSIDGLKIKEINNKGKFIYWILSDNSVIFQTLGMSGGWYHINKPNTAILLTYLDGLKLKKLYYVDQRRFGTFKFLDNRTGLKELAKKLATIGPDLLNDKDINKKHFIDIMHKPILSHKNITKVITDQKIISGIGNYLKAESLYAAKINPHRTVGSLTDTELEHLYVAMKHKIVGSYRTGGASIQHYSDINDVKGTFEFEIEVYGRKTDKYGNKVIAEKIAGDSQNTYWVPSIQI
jgi:DNA-formamidopyrimidine glycosylase